MPQHGECIVGQSHAGDCGVRRLPMEVRGNVAGDGDGAPQPLQPIGLVRPDVAQRVQLPVGAGDVDGRDVVSVSFDDPHRGRRRQFAQPGIVDSHR